jgi:hypothetical protein
MLSLGAFSKDTGINKDTDMVTILMTVLGSERIIDFNSLFIIHSPSVFVPRPSFCAPNIKTMVLSTTIWPRCCQWSWSQGISLAD